MKKQLFKKWAALLLSVLIVMSVVPQSAFAAMFRTTKASAAGSGPGPAEETGFSSMRLIVETEDGTIFPEDAPIISAYKNIYLLQYDSEEDAREAYEILIDLADFIEVDTGVEIAGDEIDTTAGEDVSTDTVMTKENNVLSELESALAESEKIEKNYDIAVIDTGSYAYESGFSIDAISMLGDDGADRHGHGTLMLNTILSFNPGASVLSIKALGDDGKGDMSAVYTAIEYAVSQNVKIINLSFSARMTQDSSIVEAAVKEAVEKGITVVAAAGNNGKCAKYYIPGCIEDAVTVGAMDNTGAKRAFSNYGSTVDYYVQEDSTSAAAAFVSAFLSAGNSIEDHIRANDESGHIGMIRALNIPDSGKAPEEGSGQFAAAAISDVTQWLGVTRTELVNWLKTHEKDSYYLNTPYNYKSGNYTASTIDGRSASVSIPYNPYYLYGSGLYVPWSFYDPYGNGLAYEDYAMVPNGAGAGVPQMNCGGFVAHALLYAKNRGTRDDDAYAIWQENLRNVGQAQTKPVSASSVNVNSALGLTGAYSFKVAAANAGFAPSREFSSDDGLFSTAISNMLASGYLKKGDIIIFQNTAQLYARDSYGNFNDWHIGIFWGDSSDEDKFWHSTHESEGLQVADNPAYLKGSVISGKLNDIVNSSGSWEVSQVEQQTGAVLGNIISKVKPKSQYGRILVYRLEDADEGRAQIIKTSASPSVTDSNACYSLKGAVFGIYYTREEAQSATNENRGYPAAVLITGEDGKTLVSEPLITGTYYVRELAAPKGFASDPDVRTVVVSKDKTSSVTYTDTPYLDPIGILLQKRDKTTGEAAAMGAGVLEGAEYTVKYFDGDSVSKTPKRTWVFKTDASGYVRLSDLAKVSGDSLYVNSSGIPSIPIGTITIEETKAPRGYTKNDSVITIYIVEKEGRVDTYWDAAGTDPVTKTPTGTSDRDDLAVFSDEQMILGALSVQKIDKSTGSAPAGNAANIEFEISYANDSRNAASVAAGGATYTKGQKITTIKTNATGYAETANDLLPYGYYTVTETVVPASAGMVNSHFTTTILVESNDTRNTPVQAENGRVYGGVKFLKVDAVTGTAVTSGKGSLANAVISIYPKGSTEAVLTIKTGADGIAVTSADALPYGDYYAKETAPANGYLINSAWQDEFSITQNGVTVDRTSVGKLSETPIYGGVKFAKVDAVTQSTVTAGKGSLADAEITIYNNSGKEIILKNGTKVADGAAALIVKTGTDGIASTTADALPYGDYYAKETLCSEGYILNSTWRDEFSITENGVILDRTSANPISQMPIYGGVKFAKIDSVTGTTILSGSGTLAGAVITIYNNNGREITLKDGTKAADGAAVITVTTGTDGIAAISAEALPYGDYYAKETTASAGYGLNSSWRDDFSITQNGVIADRTTVDPLPESPVYAGVRFSKIDAKRKTNIPQGNAVLSDAEITVYNNSGKEITLKDNTKVADGAAVITIKTDADGNAQTATDILPAGSYYAVETRPSAGYLLNSDWRADFKVTEADAGKHVDATGEPLPEIEQDGSAEVIKKDAENMSAQGDGSLAGIRFAVVNTSSEAVVMGGSTYEKNTVVGILTTDVNGKASTAARELPFGSYMVYELSIDAAADAELLGKTWTAALAGTSPLANTNGYLCTDRTGKPFDITADGQKKTVTFSDKILRGGVKTEKWDAELNRKGAQGDADFSGIQFEITLLSDQPVYINGEKKEKGDVVAVVTANADGDVQTSEDLLPYGTYEIKEVAVNGRYRLTDGAARIFAIREDGKLTSVNTEGKPLIFRDEVIRGGIIFHKIDMETDENVPQGRASLAGAEISVYNNSQKAVVVDGEEIPKGKIAAVLTTDETGGCSLDGAYLPYGTYYAVETKPSEGYLLNSDWRIDFQIREDGVVTDALSEENNVTASVSADAKSGWIKVKGANETSQPQLSERIKRADIRFRKVDIDGRPMAGIPFLISRLDADGNAVESHVIVSGEDGIVDTSGRSKTDGKVNSLDKYAENGVFSPDSALDREANVWFGKQSAREDGVGSLIYASYRIEELSCRANEGQTMLSSELFADSEGAFTARFENGKLYNLDNIFIDLIIHPESDVTDVLSDSKTITLGSEAVIKDTVRFDHLKTDKTYKVTTVLIYEDKAENEEKIGEGSVTFRPESKDGTNTAGSMVDVEVIADTSRLNGGYVHAVSTLYITEDEGDTKIISHNINHDDERQMLFVPFLGTTAADDATGDHIGAVSQSTVITDRVHAEGLPVYRSFILEATLRGAATGEAIRKQNGEDLVTSLTVTVSDRTEVPTKRSDGGYVVPRSFDLDMPAFIFDASDVAGKDLVVTEVLYDYITGEVFLVHEDMSDEAQTVHFPKVTTEALDKNTWLHTAKSGKTTIVDMVTLENTMPGMEYTVAGSLVYQTDFTDAEGTYHLQGEVIAEHEPVTVTAEDVVTIIELEFDVDASLLEGISGVVFEDVYHNNALVCTHHDINDEKQTVNFPKIRTTARDAFTDGHFGYALGEVTVEDTVVLNNLTPGDYYAVYGTLYDSNGAVVTSGGEEVIAESEIFKATDKNMSKTLSFSFDCSETGEIKTVVFEKLLVIDPFGEAIEAAHHEDLNDKNQTVEYKKPKISTSARDAFTEGKELTENIEGNGGIYDLIKYENFMEGSRVVFRGILMDKKTGNAFLDKTGNTIEAESDIIEISSETGTAAVVFEIEDLEQYGDCTLVVFEKAFLVETAESREKNGSATKDAVTDKVIATHEDITDADQTVTVPPPKAPETGDQNSVYMYLILFIAALAGTAVIAHILQRIYKFSS